MEYFPVRYDSRVVNYHRRGFIRLATGLTKKIASTYGEVFGALVRTHFYHYHHPASLYLA